MNINKIMSELAQYIRMQEEAAAIADGLREQLKKYMEAQGVETLSVDEHRAIYKAIEAARIDTTALKREHPELAAEYTRKTTTMRFIFN